MKPDFTTMSKAELKAYVLENRDDIQAIRYLFSLRTKGEEKRRFPPLSQNGIPIEENIDIMKKAIQERLEKED
jgi:hypothetical protein